LQRTYAAIATHIRTNCCGMTSRAFLHDKQVVFALQEPPAEKM
jgi:hypothetical protein